MGPVAADKLDRLFAISSIVLLVAVRFVLEVW